MKDQARLKDLGEKEIIRSIIRPMFNPHHKLGLVGDDCAVIDVSGIQYVSISTDRVPADLISFKLGLIDYVELGYYLAILNISDVLSSGASFVGLLLNLAFKEDFLVQDLEDLLKGVDKACGEYGGQVLGGDLSSAMEMNISATSIGVAEGSHVLYRYGTEIGDHIYCSNYLGLTSTAFHYFLKAKPSGLSLSQPEEDLLVNQFRKPKALSQLSRKLTQDNLRLTCMDNTDGIGQSLLELSEANSLRFVLKKELLPIHDLSFKIAEFLRMDVLEIALGTGADFQLVGTIDGSLDTMEIRNRIGNEVSIIGSTDAGNGLWMEEDIGESYKLEVSGWDYYSPVMSSLSEES